MKICITLSILFSDNQYLLVRDDYLVRKIKEFFSNYHNLRKKK